MPDKPLWTVENLSNRRLLNLLRRFHACQDAIDAVGEMDAKEAFAVINSESWLESLLEYAGGQFGLPTLTAYFEANEPLYGAYEANLKPLYGAYEPTLDPLK